MIEYTTRSWKWIILFSVLPFLMNAHEPDQAFYSIKKGEGQIEIVAELPWSLRNALLVEYPELSQSQDRKDFENAFKSYVKKNIKIHNQSDNVLELIEVREIPNEAHSHASKYGFIFEGDNIHRIQNTMLMNLYSEQKNHHVFLPNYESFITTAEVNSFEFSFNTMNSKNVLFVILLGFILLLIYVLVFFNRRNS